MNLEEYRTLFVVVTLGLSLVAASPALIVFLPFHGGSEEFSELWLLGPWHMAEGYPSNVGVDQTYSVFVGVDNHMGRPEYYRVYVKFRNMTEPLPDIDNSTPSSLTPLHEFRFFVGDGETWETHLTFAFQNVTFQADSVSVGGVTINGATFSVDSFSVWDAEGSGYYFQLFFELWRYDTAAQGFRFHDRFVGIRLNMTGS